MKAMSKFWMALVVGVAVMAVSIPSWAGPLMPSFPDVWTVGQKVAGQSTLGVIDGDGKPLTVDWIVVFWGNVGPGGEPVWGYYYQIENPETQPNSSKTVSVFTISTPGPPFFDAGFISNQSLDVNFSDIYGSVPGHTAANYPNLGSSPPPAEFEPTPGNIQNPTGVSHTTRDVTYYFGPPPTQEIAVGNQSTVLYAYAFVPPTYGIATAQDTDVQWRGSVPIPSPEPGTIVLLVLGTVGMGILRRYRRK